MENLRMILHQYNPKTAILIGNRFVVPSVQDGYMSGGGYVLSRKALYKFVRRQYNIFCHPGMGGAEDLRIGKCLQNEVLNIDAHDELGQKQFFPIDVKYHMWNWPVDNSYWYDRYSWLKAKYGLDCCSQSISCMHYIPPKEMYTFEYLIYNVYPFGLERKIDKLPRKMTLTEVIEASDARSLSPNYVRHKIIHHIDDDEKY